MADFRSETGATADEADRAKKSILDLSARNVQPMQEIGAALTKVHTDLGLVGDEAERETELFLKFGRVTKRDAAAEVVAFDDILDAWKLTAKDTGAVMDALVVSHQRYGGVIADDEAALAALAPALLATNQTWQDGIGLLDLFKASGVESADAVIAMTKALAKIKSPEELKKLIADIIATEDPLQRAALASDLFGAKAGPKLANVLKPGIGSIDDYKISVDDAAGATAAAADVLDSTWGAQFDLLLKRAGTAIIGFGDQWGGLATVIATTLTVAGGVAGKLAGPLIGGLRGAWVKVAGSSIVAKAAAFAGGKAATVYLAGLIAGDAISEAIAGGWKKVVGSSVVQGALGKAGQFMGSSIGKGLSVALAAAAVIAVVEVAKQVQDGIDAQKAALLKQARDFAEAASTEALQGAREGVRKQLEDQLRQQSMWSTLPLGLGAVFNRASVEAGAGTEGVLAAIDAELARRGSHNSLGGRVKDDLVVATPAVVAAATTLGTKAGAGFDNLAQHAKAARDAIRNHADNIALRIHLLTSQLLGEATALINGYYDPIIQQDELRVLKDTVTADTIARNATKAGTAERHQADLTLANSKKSLDQTRLNLLASGDLTRKDQKAWLADLKKSYKTATGSTKTYIGELIDKIHELQRVPTTIVRIVASISSFIKAVPRAGGGTVTAGTPYLVNENTPNSEIWVPEVSGRVLGPSATPASGSATTRIFSPNIRIEGLVKARNALEIARQLQRFEEIGDPEILHRAVAR